MNQILEKAEQGIRAKSKAKGIDRVVDAGVRIMFSDGGSKLFKEQIDKPGDVIDNAAEGTAKLVGILFEQSKKTMPLDTAVTGAVILLYRGLDFLEEAGRIEVTNEVVAQATKALTSYVLQLFGVTPEKIGQLAADKGQTMPAKKPGLVAAAMGGA